MTPGTGLHHSDCPIPGEMVEQSLLDVIDSQSEWEAVSVRKFSTVASKEVSLPHNKPL
jgi:hypothetical protein